MCHWNNFFEQSPRHIYCVHCLFLSDLSSFLPSMESICLYRHGILCQDSCWRSTAPSPKLWEAQHKHYITIKAGIFIQKELEGREIEKHFEKIFFSFSNFGYSDTSTISSQTNASGTLSILSNILLLFEFRQTIKLARSLSLQCCYTRNFVWQVYIATQNFIVRRGDPDLYETTKYSFHVIKTWHYLVYDFHASKLT